MSSPSGKEEIVVLGAVVRAHGLKGTLRVRWFGESPPSLDPPESILLRPTAGPPRRERLEWIRPHPKGVLLKLAGVNSPETAKLLVGAEIGIDRCDLPEPGEGEVLAILD